MTSGTNRHPLNVCFVVPEGYGMLAGSVQAGQIGGAEKQMSLLGRELAARGHRVSFVVWDYGQPDSVEHHGVRVLKMCRTEAGIPGLRFLHPRASSMWTAMRRANADVYIQRTADDETGVVAAWCKLHRRRFIFSVASNVDCVSELPYLGTRRRRMLYRFGLKRADCVIAQTKDQQALLRSHFDRDSLVIRSCSEDGCNGFIVPPPMDPPRVLWVGRFRPEKQLEWFLDLAHSCPEFIFDVVGPVEEKTAYVDALVRRGTGLDNVVMHGAVHYSEMATFYRQAAVLCLTSAFEGFPNTYLEAWSHGRPVVSTVDPDGVVTRNKLGVVAEDVPGLARSLREILSAPDRWRLFARNARRQFLENHKIKVVGDRFEQLLQNTVSRP